MEVTRRKTYTRTETVPENLEGFRDWEFTSGTTTGKDFKRFARLFRKFVKDSLPAGAELVDLNRGHYILNGFIKKDGSFVYFSISDVRYFKNEWAEHMLIRTVEGEEDYTGGPNQLTDLDSFGEDVSDLLDN